MKVLVIGCGSIGKRHAENFSALADVSIYDTNEQSAQSLSQNRFSSMEEAFHWKPDATVISTPHNTHLGLALQALESDTHVLVEKPISNEMGGVSQLIDLARTKNKKLNVVCNMRFHSAITAIKDNLKRIGRPLFAKAYYGNYLPNMRPGSDYTTLYAAQRSQGGGVILDAIHEVDYLRWLFGPVKTVLANADKLSDLKVDVEDYAVIHLNHASGVRSTIHLDYLQRCKRRGCEMVGEKGTLVWSSVGKNPEICQVRLYSVDDDASLSHDPLPSSRGMTILYENQDEPINQPYQLMAKQFVDSLSQDIDGLASGDDGMAALQIALASLESAKKKSWVVV